MTKTPEELTEDWKAGKLPAGWYYLNFENGEIELQNNCIGGFLMSCNNRVIQILAPVPTYKEYKAMQAELAEHRHYCCCAENEVMRLKLAGLEDQIANASKKVEELEDEIAELEKENKQLEEDTGYGWHTAGIESDKNDELRGLLKKCLPIVSDEIMTWQIRSGEESYKRGQDLLTHINAALNESEER